MRNERINFSVSVVGYNAETFTDNYSDYITSDCEDDFGNHTFSLFAPAQVYDEIADLTEDGIEIME